MGASFGTWGTLGHPNHPATADPSNIAASAAAWESAEPELNAQPQRH